MYKAPREARIAENSGDQPASYLMRLARRPKASFTYPSFTSVCCHSSFQAVRQLGAHSGQLVFSEAAIQPKPVFANWSSTNRTLATSPLRPHKRHAHCACPLRRADHQKPNPHRASPPSVSRAFALPAPIRYWVAVHMKVWLLRHFSTRLRQKFRPVDCKERRLVEMAVL